MSFESDFFDTTSFSWLWTSSLLWQPLISLETLLNKGSEEVIQKEGVFYKGIESIEIHEGCKIDPGVFLEGPCIIGKNSRISHGAYIRPYTVLGENVFVGHAAEIKSSLLMDGAKVTHFCYVGNSIIGPNCNLGAGVKCSNFRLDHKEISVFFEGEKIKTGLKKFGAILGEGVQVGCNAVLNPGTLVGKESFIYPLSSSKGSYSKRSNVWGIN